MKRCLLLALSWLACSGFYLSWQQTGTVTGFEIQRKAAGGTYAPIAKLGGNVTSYQDTDPALVGGTNYCYQVRAVGAGGTSPWSTELCMIFAGVRIYLPAGSTQTVLVSRRATSGSSIAAILVNANEMVAENVPGARPANAVTVNMKPGVQLLTSRRATSGASTIPILVNANEVVTVNGVVQ